MRLSLKANAQVAVVRQNVEARLQEMLYSILGITVLVLVIISVIGILMTGALLRPLGLMKNNLDDIAAGEGDLTRRLTITSNDEMNAQIASAAEEQTAVAEEINRSVHQIADAVESVADETRQSAHTSRSLAELGASLDRLVGQFRV